MSKGANVGILSSVKIVVSTADAKQDEMGGKAWNLFRLSGIGLNVPPLFCITAKRVEHIKEKRKAILAAFDTLDSKTVAVRSSGAAEDSADATFAGLFESQLNIDRPHLIDAIIRVFESKDSARVKAYAAEKKIDVSNMRIGVVVQKQIGSVVSGVAFSQVGTGASGNPRSGIVEAVWGLGETIVQGLDTPERYLFDRTDLDAPPERRGGNQLTMRVASSDGVHGSVVAEVPYYKRLRRRLSTSQVRKIAEVVSLIEVQLPDLAPVDIEFALHDEILYILQARKMAT